MRKIVNTCILDGRKIKDRKELHDRLADLLGLPCWYGRNLDALYDCLTDIGEETKICFLYQNRMEERLGKEYVEILIEVIQRAAKENRNIKWETAIPAGRL